MSNFINLTCSKCGAKLQITKDIDRFTCSHCRNEQVVIRSGGIVTLAPVVNEVKGVKKATNKTASELAIVRLQKEIEEIDKERDKISPNSDLAFIAGTWVVTTIIGFILVSSVNSIIGFGLISLMTVGCVTAFILIRLRADKRDKPLKKIMAEKKKELQKHQEIVSS